MGTCYHNFLNFKGIITKVLKHHRVRVRLIEFAISKSAI